MSQQGLFITFEGGEGAGKSTQIRLLKERLEAAGYTVTQLREPGGTPIGEDIRSILLDTGNTAMAPWTELFLYEAARAQLVEEVIRPALERGEVVLCDRFFDSTTVYQGMARGLGVEQVQQANALACNGLVPDRTILLRLDTETGLDRATRKEADRIEQEGLDFHQKVHEGFERLLELDPERIRVVDTCEFKEATAQRIFLELEDLFVIEDDDEDGAEDDAEDEGLGEAADPTEGDGDQR